MKEKLTKKLLRDLPAKPKRYTVWDTELPRLGVEVAASGKKRYLLDYTTPEGVRRRMVLAAADTMPPSEARKLARAKLAAVARGEDPIQTKREARKRGMTLSKLWELYEQGYLDHPRPAARKGHRPLTEKTRASYRWYWTKYLQPALGRRRVDSITPEDAEALHQRLGSHSATNANRTLALLGSMYTFAEHAKILNRGSNPTRGLVRFEERQRQRFLSAEELARLGKALRDAEEREPWQALAAIRLLLFTGARKGEVLAMRWDDLDLERGLWNLPTSKTGARPVYLNAPAVALLTSLPRLYGCPWVLPGRNPADHFKGLPHPWQRIRRAAGLDGVRLHDLRHSAASVALAGGTPLEVIQKLLGHREARTTSRYAHLAADPVREAAEKLGSSIETALAGDGGERAGTRVVPLRGGARGR